MKSTIKPPFFVEAKRQFRKSVGRKPGGGQAFFWLTGNYPTAIFLTHWLLNKWDEGGPSRRQWTEAELKEFEVVKAGCIERGGPPKPEWQKTLERERLKADAAEAYRALEAELEPDLDETEAAEVKTEKPTGDASQPVHVSAAPPPAPMPAPVSVPASVPAGSGEPMLSQALAVFNANVGSSSRSVTGRYSLVRNLSNCNLADRPLSRWGFDAISGAIDNQIKLAKTGRIAPETAVNRIGALRQFIGWLNKTDSFGWHAFPDWKDFITTELRKLSGLRRAAINARRRSNQITPANLAPVFKAASSRMKVCLLLACNTGMANLEISTLTPAMIHTDADQPFIERPRHKTGVEGRWQLWHETTALLRAELAKRQTADPHTPLLLTDEGTLLVRQSERGVPFDNIGLTWARLLEKVGIIKTDDKGRRAVKGQGKGWSFSFIRKYSGQWIRDNYGKELSEAFLSHSDAGVSVFYTSFNRWQEMDKAIAALRNHFALMFA